MQPSTSWVARWNKKSTYIPGVYALKVNDYDQNEQDEDIFQQRVSRTQHDEDIDESNNDIFDRKKRDNLKRKSQSQTTMGNPE